MSEFIHTPIEYLPGVGPQRAALLAAELNVRTVGELLHHFPFRYIDRSVITPIAQVHPESDAVQIRGTLGPVREEGTGAARRLRSSLHDATGAIELIWFQGIRWVAPQLLQGAEYVAFGKPGSFKGAVNLPHPELERIAPGTIPAAHLQPVYPSTEALTKKGLHSKGLEKLIETALQQPAFHIPETLSESLVERFKFLSKAQAMRYIHRPTHMDEVRQAQRRLKFEELFFIQLEMLLRRELRHQDTPGFTFATVADAFHTFYQNHLPFELTDAQKRVLREIRRDLGSGRQMNRLLQGDVGSGKTMVAALTALIAIDNGFQVSVMAPTEILAQQHHASFTEMLSAMPISVGLLTGSTRTAARKAIHRELEDGSMHIIIGTHALLEDKVQFKNLGLAVIDEQHRFGVAQRARLWQKNNTPPHVLVMTATPIPRTLAMTLYGDLDVSVINQLPPGRKPVTTKHLFDTHRLRIFGFMEQEIKKGRQVYVVYPLIEESASLDLKDLMDGYESIARRFPPPQYQISIVHGRMKPQDKDWEMQRFARGETHIMVATTVIEVGVNVPNASVMVIESAQRFGLSQLHQLRGRVGRGAEQSYCILVSDVKLSAEARLRLETMCQTNDGFKIAETDLQLRGPGDLMGTKQSGILDLKIANLATDGIILQYARDAAQEMLHEDPWLQLPKNKAVRQHAQELIKDKPNWSKIS
jgi:ATP-dependent DNA helicase RecG